MKTLETERLVLREMDANDALDLYKIVSDEDTAYWAGMRPVDDIDDVYCMIEYGKDCQYGITKKGENKVIGLIQIYGHFWDKPSRRHLGYFLSSEERGNHYMKEAVDAVCEYLFSHPNIDCITLDIRGDNPQSRAVAASCGFIFDEEQPEWEKDTNRYGYLLDEFNKLRYTKAVNCLGDFLSFGSRESHGTRCAA